IEAFTDMSPKECLLGRGRETAISESGPRGPRGESHCTGSLPNVRLTGEHQDYFRVARNPGSGRPEEFPLTKAANLGATCARQDIRHRIFESRQSWSTALIYRRAPRPVLWHVHFLRQLGEGVALRIA